MLRRVARVLRALCFSLGVLLLALLSMNCLGGYGYLSTPGATMGAVRGQAFLWIAAEGYEGEGFDVSYVWSGEIRWPSWRLPWIEPHRPNRTYSSMVYVPLWLPAAICLAWPVTSLVLARRRHKRGFPVVQPEVRDQKSEVSPPSEAPKVRP